MAARISRKELQVWFKTQPREVMGLVAARAALRITPLLALALPEFNKNQKKSVDEVCAKLLLPTLRCLEAAWVFGVFPADETKQAALDASAGVGSTVSIDAAAGIGTDSDAAAVAAIVAVDAAAAADASDASTVTAVAAYAAYVADAETDAYAALQFDIDMVKAGENISSMKLWAHVSKTPKLILDDWQKLKSYLLSRNESWHVWIDWYEARIHGITPNKALEIARVTLPDELWKNPPALNAKIQELIDLHSIKAPDNIRGPLPYKIIFKNGKFTALPVADEPTTDHETVQGMHEGLKRRVSSILKLMKTSNSLRDPILEMDMQDLATDLAADLNHILIGKLLDHLWGLENLKAAYADKANNFDPSLSSAVATIWGNLQKLCSTFNTVLEIEERITALDLRDGDIVLVLRDTLGRITDLAKESPIVDASVPAALKLHKKNIDRTTKIIALHAGGTNEHRIAVKTRAKMFGQTFLIAKELYVKLYEFAGPPVKKGLRKGLEDAAHAAPSVIGAGLLHAMHLEMLGLAAGYPAIKRLLENLDSSKKDKDD